MLDQDNPFWQFSVSVYGAPDVAAECLALQESLGIDVNILLLCAWAGARGYAFDDARLAEIEQRVGDWHAHIVRPLRAIRRDIKTMPEMAHTEIQEFRKEVAAAELRAERIEQALLFEAVQKLTAGTAMVSADDSIRNNISAYLTRAARGAGYMAPTTLIASAAAYKEDN